MAEIIRMPKMSDTMEEGVIAQWLKKVGDKVKPGDILAEVETDKATMELESYDEGTLLHIGVKEKDAVPVNGIIAILGEEGENIDDILKGIDSGDDTESAPEEDKSKGESSEKAKETTVDIDVSGIAATVITMPKMSDTMQEGTIASWLKKVGDEVKSGDVLAEVETDKATMELESYDDGTLLYIGVNEGDAVEVNGVIAIIGDKGADFETLLKAHQQKTSSSEASGGSEAPKDDKSETKTEEVKKESAPTNTTASSTETGRIKASPLAKKIASEKGIDISLVQGSGDSGRIIKKDIENFDPSKVAATASASGNEASSGAAIGQESYTDVKVSQMRKVIAKRLAESKFTAPHFYLTMEINMDKAMEARKSMNEIAPVKISFNDMVIKAAAVSLKQHPAVNSAWMGDKIRFNDHVHIGMAVAIDDGLLVPVIRFTDSKSLSEISKEAKSLAGKAKNKELQPKDWEGNTFTVSNLGMFGIEEFTAIINPPDACILAIGGIKQTPIVKDGEIKIGNVMKVTLSCDHRVVDGVVGSAYLKTLKSLLEDPVRLLI
ncbi:pyruvate dehydrogenase complex dihydrolipoamide acetyltransferase [Cyclobacterium amurskyense]|uniref:Acetyltransferase component of pyruvate dehydrogenase complex n=1 Tax=Cyclobacterium amurskyense TaxID=320787 RepID=A0A0H4PAC8_9BACT|nr:pyruvate dehydrogenase complex dihydrolipoamide acetyltransferase [Cyclobacterium amurskyense]AKP50075.1 Acetyltransferase component of pyruvate dehydrogenase complex [Cyclobacterium amurskyense]